MKFKIQMVIEGEEAHKEDLICIERDSLLPETTGLTVKESKQLTSSLQKKMISYQIKEFIAKNRYCSCCYKKHAIKGYHSMVYRTLFGNITFKSPRFWNCACQKEKATFSPLSELFPERTTPEFMYLQSKWAALISYDMTAKMLKEFLPLETNHASIRLNTHHVSERIEGELKGEQYMFVEGCPRDWENLPKPDMPITVGIDGGYIHARDGDNRKAGWFEAIVGKSLQEKNETKRFGFVSTYDEKPKRRVYEVLNSQGLQMNQEITFLSDGGDTVRNLQLYLSPRSEHILDWFHIAMRITNMKQMAKGVPKSKYTDYEKELDRAKWYLWHGNAFRSLQVLENLRANLEVFSDENRTKSKLYKYVNEFYTYIKLNASFIPNYGNRYRNGEIISTSFVESTVNEIISKRMVKKQQMRWTKKGAHLLLQIRVKVLDNELKKYFTKWYPGMGKGDMPIPLAA